MAAGGDSRAALLRERGDRGVRGFGALLPGCGLPDVLAGRAPGATADAGFRRAGGDDCARRFCPHCRIHYAVSAGVAVRELSDLARAVLSGRAGCRDGVVAGKEFRREDDVAWLPPTA